jgi:RNA polymerase sigma-70 factor (ECF subfamily)
MVNGAVGIVARSDRGIIAVAGMTVIRGRITEIDLVLDADKLAGPSVSRP